MVGRDVASKLFQSTVLFNLVRFSSYRHLTCMKIIHRYFKSTLRLPAMHTYFIRLIAAAKMFVI